MIRGIVKVHKPVFTFAEEDIFPSPRQFEVTHSDAIEETLFNRPANRFLRWFRRSTIFQTGMVQHCILYAGYRYIWRSIAIKSSTDKLGLKSQVKILVYLIILK